MRTRRLAAVLVAGLALLMVDARPANAVTPKVAVIIGDSLTYESRFQIASRMALRPGWSQFTYGVILSAPCDWLAILPTMLAHNPSIVGLMTAGNTNGSACMTAPTGSAAYYAQYRADLNTLFAAITATGAKVVFQASPPFTDPARNTAVKQLKTIATELAYLHHGVSIASSLRTALSANGLYAQTKPCIATETLAQGCVNGRIDIRTRPGLIDSGLHLCPTGLQPGTFGVCAVYSSGEFRFARAMVNSLVAPPPPKMI